MSDFDEVRSLIAFVVETTDYPVADALDALARIEAENERLRSRLISVLQRIEGLERFLRVALEGSET